MPAYEFRCRACGQNFTENRAMAASADPATCPQGHGDTVRLLGIAGIARGAAAGVGQSTRQAAGAAGGGCCGGGCCS